MDATLALIQSNNRVDAARSAKWLVGQRNSQGGFGTTQDTVVALQALIEYATLGATDTNMTVTVSAGDMTKDVKITPENYDVTQVVEVPAGEVVKVTAKGKGEAVVQGVLRYNLPKAEGETSVFDIRVDYDTDQVGIVSIPRDLWVNIPGFGPGRINQVDMQGELQKVKGGGPAHYGGYGGFDWRPSGSPEHRRQTGQVCQPAYALHSVRRAEPNGQPAGPDDPVRRCMRIMTDRRIRHLPVVDSSGAMVGVISIGDLVSAVIEEQQETIEQLEKFIAG